MNGEVLGSSRCDANLLPWLPSSASSATGCFPRLRNRRTFRWPALPMTLLASRRRTRPRPGWEAGALALREAARRRSTYVIVSDDPLADVAAAWRAMWELPGGSGGSGGPGGPAAAAKVEERAAEALAA